MEALALGKGLQLKLDTRGYDLYSKAHTGRQKKKIYVNFHRKALPNFDILEYAKKLKILNVRVVFIVETHYHPVDSNIYSQQKFIL